MYKLYTDATELYITVLLAVLGVQAFRVKPLTSLDALTNLLLTAAGLALAGSYALIVWAVLARLRLGRAGLPPL